MTRPRRLVCRGRPAGGDAIELLQGAADRTLDLLASLGHESPLLLLEIFVTGGRGQHLEPKAVVEGLRVGRVDQRPQEQTQALRAEACVGIGIQSFRKGAGSMAE